VPGSFVFVAAAVSVAAAAPVHVFEKVELTFTATGKYTNPYTDVEVWLDLKGPHFNKRCYGFWDGGQTFRVRIMSLEPGTWSWVSGSSPADSGLAGKKGSFQSIAWTEEEKHQNANRRGIPQATPNGHTLQWSDGTPYFIQGDYFYPASTTRYIWRDSDESYPVDSPRAGFKDILKYRKAQGFNMIYVISSFPNWGYDGWPATFRDEAGVPVRGAWPNGNQDRAENMVNEENEKPFFFPGKAVGYSEVGADFWRINPSYFRYLDKKVDYAGAQGFQVFIETLRRDIGPYLRAYYGATNSDMSKNAVFYYIRYIFARYQADPVSFGIIHQDASAPRQPTKSTGMPGLSPDDWRPVLDGYHKRYGHPPFGQIVTTNISGSTYRVWGHTDKAPWLMMHQAGNSPRDNRSAEEILEMFRLPNPIPAYNQEPWYVATDTPEERAWNRGIMYGSLLSGGLAGVAYEAYGMTRGNREINADVKRGEATPKPDARPLPESPSWNCCSGPFPNMWGAVTWQSAKEVQFAPKFMMTHGAKYQDLAPHPELLSVCKTGNWAVAGWAFLMRTDDKQLFKVYFQQKAAHADISGALPNTAYRAQWLDPRTGAWINTGSGTLTSDAQGRLAIPPFPTAGDDWALSLSTN
jgi:hypothetical protein